MSKRFIIIITILIIVVGVSSVLIINGRSDAISQEIDVSLNEKVGDKKYDPKISEGASVVVEATPKTLSHLAEKTIIEVSLNTHSVDLNYDFASIMILQDDLGNIYPAIEWSGPSGGHHIYGDIIFDKINPEASSAILIIKSLNGVDHRLSWKIK